VARSWEAFGKAVTNMIMNFLVGFGVGLTVGMVFAPKSGECTRQYLASMASDGIGYIKKQSDEFRETALDAVERGRHVVNRQMERFAPEQNSAAEIYQR
jgi:gas vesicle protein